MFTANDGLRRKDKDHKRFLNAEKLSVMNLL